jgi:hypothetical protein
MDRPRLDAQAQLRLTRQSLSRDKHVALYKCKYICPVAWRHVTISQSMNA